MKSLLALLVLTACTFASAQSYPSKEIVIINPAAPGAAASVMFNTIGQYVSNKKGIKITVVDKPGADKLIGANFAAAATPDGYTLLGASTSDVILLPLINPPGLQFENSSFVPVASLVVQNFVLVVPATSSVSNLSEFLVLVKRDPTKVPVGTFSGLTRLDAARLYALVGASPTTVQYTGDVKVVTDVAGGFLPAGIASINTASALAKAGKIKIIAYTGKSRPAEFPNTMTVNELYPGFTAEFWWGLYAPRGTPSDIVTYLHREFTEALQDPVLVQQLMDKTYIADPMTLPQLQKFNQSQIKKYDSLVEQYLK